jgi:hypothetical protein
VFSRESFSRDSTRGDWSYFLEGGICNVPTDVFALPKAMAALHKGQYFVSQSDNDLRIDTICRELKKRGVTGADMRSRAGA